MAVNSAPAPQTAGRFGRQPIFFPPFSLTCKQLATITDPSGLRRRLPSDQQTHEDSNRRSWRCALAVAFPDTCAGATALMPIDEVQPGMVGVGRTVFEGTELDGVQGPHPRRPAQRPGPAPQPDPRAARRRPARQDRRHRGHERQPGLHRRAAGRRRLVLARGVLEGSRLPASRRSPR